MVEPRYYRLNRYDADGLVGTETYDGTAVGLHRAAAAFVEWTDRFGGDADYASVTPVM